MLHRGQWMGETNLDSSPRIIRGYFFFFALGATLPVVQMALQTEKNDFRINCEFS